MDRWSGDVEPLERGAFGPRSLLTVLPAYVAEAYQQNIIEADLGRLTVGLCCFGDAVVLFDDLMDYESSAYLRSRHIVRASALYLCACAVFAELNLGIEFWQRLRQTFHEYSSSLRRETDATASDAAWHYSFPTDCIAIAKGKNGLVRLVNAALASYFKREADPVLDAALIASYFAYQMLDDLTDWREDLRGRKISTLLRLRFADGVPENVQASDLGIELFRDGHADEALGFALQALTDAQHALPLHAGNLKRQLNEQANVVVAARTEIALALRSKVATS